MRELSGLVTQVQQEGCDGVRHRRAFGSQHAITVYMLAPHVQGAGELRSVARIDLEEDDRLARRDMIILSLLRLFSPVFIGVPAVATVSYDPDRAFTGLVNYPLRLF